MAFETDACARVLRADGEDALEVDPYGRVRPADVTAPKIRTPQGESSGER